MVTRPRQRWLSVCVALGLSSGERILHEWRGRVNQSAHAPLSVDLTFDATLNAGVYRLHVSSAEDLVAYGELAGTPFALVRPIDDPEGLLRVRHGLAAHGNFWAETGNGGNGLEESLVHRLNLPIDFGFAMSEPFDAMRVWTSCAHKAGCGVTATLTVIDDACEWCNPPVHANGHSAQFPFSSRLDERAARQVRCSRVAPSRLRRTACEGRGARFRMRSRRQRFSCNRSDCITRLDGAGGADRVGGLPAQLRAVDRPAAVRCALLQRVVPVLQRGVPCCNALRRNTL
jgi:hypothetical protein